MSTRSSPGLSLPWCATAMAGILFAAGFAACVAEPAPFPPLPTGPDDRDPLGTGQLPQLPPPGQGDEVPGAAAPPVVRATMPNGMTTMALRYVRTPERTAEITLAVLAGTDMGKRGLADLAAAVVTECSDATAGRRSLRATIADLGGTLHTETGPLSTWFTIRVPESAWQESLTALGRALREPPPGRSQLERVQQQLLQQRTDEILGQPAPNVAARLLLGDRGSDEHLDTLQQRDPSETVVFLSHHYRPDRALLAVRAPAEAWAVGLAVNTELGAWTAAGPPRDLAGDTHTRRMRGGLYWAPAAPAAAPPEGSSPDRCRVFLVLSMPDPMATDAAAQHMLLNCVTMDGIGGRLERMQRDAGLAGVTWQPHFVSCAEVSATVLEGSATSEQAARLWRVANDARASLRDLPPTQSERALAGGRAWLTLRRGFYGDGTEMRVVTTSVLRGVTEEMLIERLGDLQQPDAVTNSIMTAFLEQPMALVVVGGAPPAELEGVTTFALVPEGFATTHRSTGADALVQAAEPWLDRAEQAAGGAAALRRLRGFDAAALIRTDGAPDIQEEIEWSPGGALVRRRTILGSTVETRIHGTQWLEQLGEQRAELSALEANWRLAESERHPLALLCSHAQGRLQFRLLTTRTYDERDHLLLEAVTDRFERLRVQIDKESSLIRVVEAWTTSPRGAPTYTVDTWSDYRTVDGLRVPFRRETVVDDGQSRRVTDYERVTIRR